MSAVRSCCWQSYINSRAQGFIKDCHQYVCFCLCRFVCFFIWYVKHNL